MAKNDLVLLDGILDEYQKQGIPSSKADEVFEYFATTQILKNYAFSHDQIMSGLVDGRNDGGIDEFFVLVNGHLAENIPDDFWPRTNSELEIFIITCKHDDSFRQVPINTMIPSLIQLFDFTIPSHILKDSYNEKVLMKRELFLTAYKKLAASLVKFQIHLVYACRGTEEIEPNIQSKADQAKTICQESFSECSASFSFWGNSKLLTSFRERPSSMLDLKFEQCINQDGQYILLSTIKEYCKFITDSHGNLDKHLFDSNVRDYLGLNPVNIDILNSLHHKDGPNFWWLNNGITLIGTKAQIVGNVISVENAQIVNGLQTSESIFKYIIETTPLDEHRSVLIKILLLNDLSMRNDIIYATNNQTNVTITALRANDKVQKDIEDILKKHHIFYERRTNYCKNQGIQNCEITTPLLLAAGYIGLIYKNPYTATVLKQRFMRDINKYEQIFSTATDINVWVPIALLIKATDKFLNNLRDYKHGMSQAKFLKNFRQIVLFLTVSRIMGSFAFGEKDLITFDLTHYTQSEVEKTLADIQELNFIILSNNKRIPAQFYSECFFHLSKKYNIAALSAIRAKNLKLWPVDTQLSRVKLSNEILEEVFHKLPVQPWPLSTHKMVAEKIGKSELVVSNAIAYLIYTRRVNAQVYGYIFDNSDAIIAEGEHYGHTETEARNKLALQRMRHERMFEFGSSK